MEREFQRAEHISCGDGGEEGTWHRTMEEGVQTLSAAQMVSGRGEDLPAPPHRLALAAAATAAAAAAASFAYF